MNKKPSRLSFYKNVRALLNAAAQPQIFSVLLLWLMGLLITGTISEKYIGLFQSQKLFFSSFVIWFGGFVPMPGGYTTLALIFINLLCKLIVEKWTKQKLGTLVTHCAALLLLFGGFLTTVYSSEGYMAIEEGAQSNFVSDYRKHELAIADISKADGQDETVFSQSQLKPGDLSSALPFTIEVERYFENTEILQRSELLTDGSVHGMLMAMDMRGAPLAPEEEKNRAGVIFRISGVGPKIDGRYAIFQDMPIEQHIMVGKKTYRIVLRGERTRLPFDVQLVKFEKQVYPGTDKPRSYQSEVIVQDGKLQWHSLISMNNPLRYKGYTFYQSSFIESGARPVSVLAVVKNIGALFPYIASIAMCIGLLIHLFIRVPSLTKAAKK